MHEAAVDRKVGLATRPYETPTPFVREFSFTLVPSLSWQMIGFHNKTVQKECFPHRSATVWTTRGETQIGGGTQARGGAARWTSLGVSTSD